MSIYQEMRVFRFFEEIFPLSEYWIRYALGSGSSTTLSITNRKKVIANLNQIDWYQIQIFFPIRLLWKQLKYAKLTHWFRFRDIFRFQWVLYTFSQIWKNIWIWIGLSQCERTFRGSISTPPLPAIVKICKENYSHQRQMPGFQERRQHLSIVLIFVPFQTEFMDPLLTFSK